MHRCRELASQGMMHIILGCQVPCRRCSSSDNSTNLLVSTHCMLEQDTWQSHSHNMHMPAGSLGKGELPKADPRLLVAHSTAHCEQGRSRTSSTAWAGRTCAAGCRRTRRRSRGPPAARPPGWSPPAPRWRGCSRPESLLPPRRSVARTAMDVFTSSCMAASRGNFCRPERRRAACGDTHGNRQ